MFKLQFVPIRRTTTVVILPWSSNKVMVHEVSRLQLNKCGACRRYSRANAHSAWSKSSCTPGDRFRPGWQRRSHAHVWWRGAEGIQYSVKHADVQERVRGGLPGSIYSRPGSLTVSLLPWGISVYAVWTELSINHKVTHIRIYFIHKANHIDTYFHQYCKSLVVFIHT